MPDIAGEIYNGLRCVLLLLVERMTLYKNILLWFTWKKIMLYNCKSLNFQFCCSITIFPHIEGVILTLPQEQDWRHSMCGYLQRKPMGVQIWWGGRRGG